MLAAMRRSVPALSDTRFLTGVPRPGSETQDVVWLTETGMSLDEAGWHDSGRYRLIMMLGGDDCRLAAVINGDRRACMFTLPERDGFRWEPAIETPDG
ncbi:MAG: glycogen debranching enzyme GlgX, partial [Mesorhizobium sp.]